MGEIHEKHNLDYSQQHFAMVTTQWLQHDQTLFLIAKGVACETKPSYVLPVLL